MFHNNNNSYSRRPSRARHARVRADRGQGRAFYFLLWVELRAILRLPPPSGWVRWEFAEVAAEVTSEPG